MKKDITIIAIETSCDDTGIAIIKASPKRPIFNVLSNIVSSQVEIHKKWGGVYPMMAKREHQNNLVPVLKKALGKANLLNRNAKENVADRTLEKILEREDELYKALKIFLARYKKPEIDAITVTVGPGLEPCLWVGVNFAKALSFFWDIPIVAVNHVEAHILANFLLKSEGDYAGLFPAVCLVVSGGHTQLFLMENFGKYKILGETRDDAAGECFDKTARILGLGYPGGPAIAAKAKQGRGKTSTLLPRPMINTKDYDFSFSGLKTAVLYNFKNQPEKIRKSKKYIVEMCAETQQAIIDVLLKKTIKAAKDFKAKTIILGGGVAANDELRKQFIENCKLKIVPLQRDPARGGENCNFLVPPKDLCTDNALMVALAGYFRWKQGKTENWRDIEAKANLRIE